MLGWGWGCWAVSNGTSERQCLRETGHLRLDLWCLVGTGQDWRRALRERGGGEGAPTLGW